MGLFYSDETKERKRLENELRLKEIDEFNLNAMCKEGNLSIDEGRALMERNIKNGIPKFRLENQEITKKIPITKSEVKVCCPKCGSTQLTAQKKGIGLGKAAVGAFTFGAYGLVAGGIGKNKIIVTCLACGKQFKPGK